MRVALYSRVSTTKQAERDLSIPDQFREMKKWCDQNGHTIASEYTDPGVSGTSGNRPSFQKMMKDAAMSPPPFDAVLVHSIDRFYRNTLELMACYSALQTHGIKLRSATQTIGDELEGILILTLLGYSAEKSSIENSKHTLRAMKECARQGYLPSAQAPFGYRKQDVKIEGNRYSKKKLIIDEAEAEIVNLIYDLSIHGLEGTPFGLKKITEHLNEKGIFKRGSRWSKSSVGDVLSSTNYIGEYYFNKRSAKTRKTNPKEEWIKINIPAIVSHEKFTRSAKIRESRSPKATAPRQVSSPALLSGLLKCSCGASMTIATGKSGKYLYYKCNERKNISKNACNTRNIRMEQLDAQILSTVANELFTYSRVQGIVEGCLRDIQNSTVSIEEEIKKLRREENRCSTALQNLYQSIENGLSLTDSLRTRIEAQEKQQTELKEKILGVERRSTISASTITTKSINEFRTILIQKMNDRDSQFGKAYLQQHVNKITVNSTGKVQIDLKD